jgi:hypothetical protein
LYLEAKREIRNYLDFIVNLNTIIIRKQIKEYTLKYFKKFKAQTLSGISKTTIEIIKVN